MLNTLLKIGKWQSEGKGEWDRFLERPKVEYEDKNGNSVKNFILPIIFDLDEKEVVIDSRNLKEYDENYIEPLKALKIQGGNNKAIYATVPSTKFIQLYKTFFGKENEKANEGEISEAILKENPSLLTDSFKKLLMEIFQLQEEFFEKTSLLNEKTGVSEINFKQVENTLELNKNENIALVYIKFKGSKFGIDTPKPFAEVPEYLDFLKSKFIDSGNPSDKKQANTTQKKLCYASGELLDEVGELDLSARYSLNKMFVTETKNYASAFDKNRFQINYQVSRENQEKLDYASNYLLNEGNYKVRIANIDHVIIPQFLESDNLDWELALTGIKKKSDVLFGFEKLENFVDDVREETDSIFWINFVAYESDGNFFKSTEIIKDVSRFHFEKVVSSLTAVSWEFKKSTFVNWGSVMTEYGNERLFNFYTIYTLIPIRKDKEKKNKVLDLFKAILENRKVSKSSLFSYFCELVLCHFYERYTSYTNIPKSSKDYFGRSVRNSVFKYLAFIQILKNLKLIDMEESTATVVEETGNKYDQAIHNFFAKMNLNQEQQAMFYLGRMLNTVEFIQKGKKKTVIEKVNFHGMDRDDIQRLRVALVEKAKQYSKVGKVIFSDRKFGELFDFNNWKLNPTEAVFFLLTGYSFGISSKEAVELDESEDENAENEL